MMTKWTLKLKDVAKDLAKQKFIVLSAFMFKQ